MIAARREERGTISHSLGNVQTQHPIVKGNRPLKVCHFQMHVTDAHLRVRDVTMAARVHISFVHTVPNLTATVGNLACNTSLLPAIPGSGGIAGRELLPYQHPRHSHGYGWA